MHRVLWGSWGRSPQGGVLGPAGPDKRNQPPRRGVGAGRPQQKENQPHGGVLGPAGPKRLFEKPSAARRVRPGMNARATWQRPWRGLGALAGRKVPFAGCVVARRFIAGRSAQDRRPFITASNKRKTSPKAGCWGRPALRDCLKSRLLPDGPPGHECPGYLATPLEGARGPRGATCRLPALCRSPAIHRRAVGTRQTPFYKSF